MLDGTRHHFFLRVRRPAAACAYARSMLTSITSLAACWKQHTKLVAVYFWLLLAHYIVDFGVLVANILAAQQSAMQAYNACQQRVLESGMTGDTSQLCSSNSTPAIIFLTILGICKLISTCMSLFLTVLCSIRLTSIVQTRRL